MSFGFFIVTTPSQLDRNVWQAICGWPEAAGFDPVREGIDYAHLTRFYLWDKAGKAVRESLAETQRARRGEVTTKDTKGAKWSGGGLGDQRSAIKGRKSVVYGLWSKVLQRARGRALNAKLAVKRRVAGTRVLYCPFPYSRNARILESLLEGKRDYEIVVPTEYAAAWPGAVPWRKGPRSASKTGVGGSLAEAQSAQRAEIVTTKGTENTKEEPESRDVSRIGVTDPPALRQGRDGGEGVGVSACRGVGVGEAEGRGNVQSPEPDAQRPTPNVQQPTTSLRFAEEMYTAMVRGVAALNVELVEEDRDRLRKQVFEAITQVEAAERELRVLKPDAILVPCDNHPPFMAHVLVARREGIPTVMLQHGLDCEPFVLDYAYADCIAVWGPARADRYRQQSAEQPRRMAVTGAPQYDGRKVPERIEPAGIEWLWLTRPHVPEKCYFPSRRPEEGLDILESLLKTLATVPDATLKIKRHSFDYLDPYREIIDASPVRDRVAFVDGAVMDLIEHAGLVVSEDSTAGMDAMVCGKIVVHAHFAPCAPTLPMVAYGAALPGFSPEELAESLKRAMALTDADRCGMKAAQKRFLTDFAGPLDGNATERFREFVAAVVGEGE